MDFLIGLLALFTIAFLVSGMARWLTHKPYRCTCGWKTHSEEEMLAHILAKNIHKLVD